MRRAELYAMSPLLVLTASAVAVLALVCLRRSATRTAVMTLAGLCASAASLVLAHAVGPRQVGPLLLVDDLALFFFALILLATLAVVVLVQGTAAQGTEPPDELYVLLLLATLGSAVMITSDHFVSLFLGLETLTISLYALIAYRRTGRAAVEAGIKYLLLAGASSAILLFGMALVYAALGTLSLRSMGNALILSDPGSSVVAGLALVVVGLAFKLALVPFHMWTPDVYQGATAPITAYVATVSKGATLALLVRLVVALPILKHGPLLVILSLLAAASMVAGTLLALLQTSIRRLLAYSSIAQLGYLLTGLLGRGPLALESVSLYLAAYFATILLAFGIVAALGERDSVDDYRGLMWSRPLLGLGLSASLLSLAGLPITAGFIAKFTVLAAGVGSGLWVLSLVLVLTSVIGLYYALRVIAALIEPTSAEPAPRPPLTIGVLLSSLAAIVIVLGLWPAPLQQVVAAAVNSL